MRTPTVNEIVHSLRTIPDETRIFFVENFITGPVKDLDSYQNWMTEMNLTNANIQVFVKAIADAVQDRELNNKVFECVVKSMFNVGWYPDEE